MKEKENLIGTVFNRLTVIGKADDYISKTGAKYRQWVCECNCQEHNKIIVREDSLKSGRTKSCGCFKREQISKAKKKYNKYDLSGKYGIGYTSSGKEFYFDLEDYDLIKGYCWSIGTDGYVTSSKYKYNNSVNIRMHKLVMPPNNLDIDHINHKKYDNRKSNLRCVTHSQNHMNKKMQSNNTSGVVGVGYIKKNNKWRATIKINGKQKHIGVFDTKEDAAIARKLAEEKYFGEFSYENSMDIYNKNVFDE